MTKHLHLYSRRKLKEKYVMACTKVGCTHYMHMNSKLSCPLLRDKIAECNRCHEPFVLDRRALRMQKPCCTNCIKRDEVRIKEVKSAEKFFEDLEKEIANDSGRIKID